MINSTNNIYPTSLNEYPENCQTMVSNLGNIPRILTWIKDQELVKVRNAQKNFSIKAEDLKTEEVTKRLFETIAEASTLVKKRLINNSNIEFSIIPMFYVFYLEVGELIDQLQVYSPEQQELVDAWDTFREILGNLRYENDIASFPKIENFVDFISHSIKQVGENNLKLLDTSILHDWKQIFAWPHISDIDFQTVTTPEAEKNEQTFLKTPVQLALRGQFTLLRRINQDLGWLIPLINNTLKSCPKNLCLGFFDDMPHQFIERVLKIILRLSNKIVTDSVEGILKTEQIVLLLASAIDSLIGANRALGPISYYIELLQTLYKHIEDNHYVSSDTELIDITEIAHQLNIIFNLKYKKDWSVSLCSLRECLEFIRKVQHCHVMADTFLASPMTSVCGFRASVKDWVNSVQKIGISRDIGRLKQLVNSQAQKLLIAKTIIITKPNTKNTHSINQEISAPQNKKKVRKNFKQKQKTKLDSKNSSETVVDQNEIKTVDIKDSKQEFECSLELTLFTNAKESGKNQNFTSYSLGNLLNKMIPNASSSNYAKVCLRQARMHLDDLKYVEKILNKSSVTSRIVLQAWNSCYYVIEQLLRFRMIKLSKNENMTHELKWHNLKRYAIKNPLPEPINTAIINNLYLANFWVAHTFDQFAMWKMGVHDYKNNIPQILLKAHALSENLSSKQTIVSKEEILESINETIALSMQLLSPPDKLEEVGIMEEDKKLLLNLEKMDLNPLKQCRYHLNALLKQVISDFYIFHPYRIDLNSMCRDIELLEEELNHLKEMTFAQFSLSIRKSIQLQQAIIEKALHLIIQSQTGEKIFEHELTVLADKIKWQAPLKNSTYEFLKTFSKMHRLSNYPFEMNEGYNGLHKLILKAEMLRENPELNEGFRINSNQTPLNFIEVNTSKASGQKIFDTYLNSMNKFVEVLQDKLIPEIKECIK